MIFADTCFLDRPQWHLDILMPLRNSLLSLLRPLKRRDESLLSQLEQSRLRVRLWEREVRHRKHHGLSRRR